MVDDATIIADLQESARTLLLLVKNGAISAKDNEADLEALNRVITYYGGTPVTVAEEPKSADWNDGYAAGYEAGFKAGFERGAYEEMTQEDVEHNQKVKLEQ